MYKYNRRQWDISTIDQNKIKKMKRRKIEINHDNENKKCEDDETEPVVNIEEFKKACLQKIPKWFGVGFQQDSCRKKIREIILNPLKFRFIIIHGPSGIGKTRIAKFTLEELGYIVKSPSIARDTLTPKSIHSFLSALEVDSRMQIGDKHFFKKENIALILDDFETIAEYGLQDETQGQSILCTIQAFVQREQRLNPLVIIMNDLYAHNLTMKKIIEKSQKIAMSKIEEIDVEKIMLRKYCKNSKMIAKMVDGDIRKALILNRFEHKKLGDFTERSMEYSIFEKTNFFFIESESKLQMCDSSEQYIHDSNKSNKTRTLCPYPKDSQYAKSWGRFRSTKNTCSEDRYKRRTQDSKNNFLTRIVKEDTLLQETMIHENYPSNMYGNIEIWNDSTYKNMVSKKQNLKKNTKFNKEFSSWIRLNKMDMIAKDLSDADMFKYEDDFKCFTLASSFKVRDKESFKRNKKTFVSFQKYSTHCKNYKISKNLLQKCTNDTRSATILDYIPILKKMHKNVNYPIKEFNGKSEITRTDMDDLLNNFKHL